ncbi:hypothetical protein CLOM_g21086 [Closterium sp. NIES-68]|nr:hypothetical protein CLOM_g21086 [Closterium sp. NIES-68]
MSLSLDSDLQTSTLPSISRSPQPAEAPLIQSASSAAAPAPFDRWIGSFDADVSASLPTTGLDIVEIVRDRGISKAVDVPYFDLPERVIKSASDWLASQGSKDLSAVAALLIHVALHDRPPSDHVSISKDASLSLLAILLRLRPAILQQVPDALLLPPKAAQLPLKDAQKPPKDGAADASKATSAVESVAPAGSHVAKADRLVILAWIFGQVARTDRVAGMSLFIHCLLPHAVQPSASPASTDLALSFLELVVLENRRKAYAELHKGAVRGGLRLVPPEALNSFLLAAFPSKAACTELTPRFSHAFLIVKQLALVKATLAAGDSEAESQAALVRARSCQEAAEKLLRLMFEAAGGDSEELRDEASSIFVWCLIENHACYDQWARLHSTALDTSRRILAFLERRWDEVKLQLAPYAPLRCFLSAIRQQHAQALRALGQSQVEERATIRQTDALARKLQRKISRLPGFLATVATLIASALMIYTFYWLSPSKNPWGWDGYILLSKTHRWY